MLREHQPDGALHGAGRNQHETRRAVLLLRRRRAGVVLSRCRRLGADSQRVARHRATSFHARLLPGAQELLMEAIKSFLSSRRLEVAKVVLLLSIAALLFGGYKLLTYSLPMTMG